MTTSRTQQAKEQANRSERGVSSSPIPRDAVERVFRAVVRTADEMEERRRVTPEMMHREITI